MFQKCSRTQNVKSCNIFGKKNIHISQHFFFFLHHWKLIHSSCDQRMHLIFCKNVDLLFYILKPWSVPFLINSSRCLYVGVEMFPVKVSLSPCSQACMCVCFLLTTRWQWRLVLTQTTLLRWMSAKQAANWPIKYRPEVISSNPSVKTY